MGDGWYVGHSQTGHNVIPNEVQISRINKRIGDSDGSFSLNVDVLTAIYNMCQCV